MQEDALPTLDPEAFRKMEDKIRIRIILLGDTKPEGPGDLFDVPGVVGKVPGVFLHACGAYTISGEPLYRLTYFGRIVLDVLIALFILFVARLGSTLVKSNDSNDELSEHRLMFGLTVVAVIVVCMLSVGLVRHTRLLWT